MWTTVFWPDVLCFWPWASGADVFSMTGWQNLFSQESGVLKRLKKKIESKFPITFLASHLAAPCIRSLTVGSLLHEQAISLLGLLVPTWAEICLPVP